MAEAAALPNTQQPIAAGNTAAPQAGGGFSFLKIGSKYNSIIFAMGVLGILSIMLFPMPLPVLDFMLSLSITISILILLNVLFIEKSLDFSSFPTILLVAAMFRLSLNIATTRTILSEGHNGTAAAGHVIEAFGTLVIGNNIVIGLIVFAILTIINFVVITKGSGRIAEVSARFSLDAMPGKQMAIDADLSAGLIDEATARKRRKELEQESTFFGAMDGASKFVRGDAVAGLIITFVNLIGGIIIGVVQRDMAVGDAGATYTTLTIGDGLVSQIPALIVSTAAGLLVTKSGVAGSADKAVFGQLGRFPQAMGMLSALCLMLAAVPALPGFPFVLLAGCAGGFSYYLRRNPLKDPAQIEQEKIDAEQKQKDEAKQQDGAQEEPVEAAMKIDAVRLELGYGLLPLINYGKGQRLTEQIKALRMQMAKDLGFIMPAVRIQDNMQLPANTYVIKIKEIECGRGDVRPDMLLVMDPTGAPIQIPGENTVEPTFGLPARWVAETSREEASFKNYTVVPPPTVITTHLTELVKDHISDLLSYSETKKLLDGIPPEHKKLVDDTVPGVVGFSVVQRVLQNLLMERVSIRDLPTIIEALAEMGKSTGNVTVLTEHVRTRLARQLCNALADDKGSLPMLSLSARWEQAFVENIVGGGEEKQLAMPPSMLQDFIKAVREVYEKFALRGEVPVLVTSPQVRPYVRAVIERFRASTMVMSQNEIHPKAKIRTVGQL